MNNVDAYSQTLLKYIFKTDKIQKQYTGQPETAKCLKWQAKSYLSYLVIHPPLLLPTPWIRRGNVE